MINAPQMRLSILALATTAIATLAQTAPTTRGLDALDDDALISELTNRELTPLLDRYLEVRNLPADQRAAVRAVVDAMHTLSAATPPTNKQRIDAVVAINANIDATIAALHDPRFFLQIATVLIRGSIERDANTLEYWGPSAALQLSLRPTAETVLKLLDKTDEEASRQRDAIAAQIVPGNQEALTPRYTKYDTLATTAEYTRNMAAYYAALTYDPAAPERRQLAQTAIENLDQFDNPDSQVQPAVRLRLGKLHLVEGDYPAAQKLLASIANNPDGEIKPAPDLSQQFDARYFTVVAEMLDNHLDDAAQQLGTLRDWSNTAIAAENTTARNGAAAATSILEYRLLMARSDAAGNAADKQALRDQARTLLTQLVAARPELRTTIYAQVLATLPPDMAIEKLDPIMLAALVREGDQERLKGPDEKLNTAVLERALAAARELVKRRGQPNVSDELVDSAFLLEGFLLDRLDRHSEAATTLLDYLSTKPANLTNAKLAMDTTLALVDQLRKINRFDETTSALYQRVLPIAIGPPFNRHELAYEYARQLQQQGRYLDAVSYFRQVPADDPRVISAHFYEMLAIKQQLDNDHGTLTGTLRGEMVADIHKLVDDVTAQATAASKNPSVPGEQQAAYRELVAKTVLVAADTALHHESQPRRTLELLKNFDTRFANAPGQADRVADALLLRVSAHMDLNQTTEATSDLVSLLSTRSGGQGAGIIYTLLQKLDSDFNAAKRNGNGERLRSLAAARAALSGYLVDWAARNPDPDIRKFTYRYRVFDAGAHRLVAQLETDAAAGRTDMQTALERYQALLSPDNHKEYLETLVPGTDQAGDDPLVLLGVASCNFDLEKYAEAQPELAQLLDGRKLGPAQIPSSDGPTNNDPYWEATYELLFSNAALIKTPDGLAPTEALLKRLYIEFGPDLGGPKWSSKFEALRKQIIPDFKIRSLNQK
ncbi:MAG TPA: hypothetical protein VFE58_19695 [Tepidisphaeraceae bacterium]|jgi:hypothetical protein|nr:hypothetical protein [Tepidisphaeraceae bacterium]